MDAEVAAAISKEVGPTTRALAVALGQSSLGRELDLWIGEIVNRWRQKSQLKTQVELLAKAVDLAERIRALGIRTSEPIDNRLLRAVLEDAGLEPNGEMQDRWAALLVNAATGVVVPPAFPEVLRQLEPIEARLLDHLVTVRIPLVHGQDTHLDDLGPLPGLRWRHLDNLERLQLLNWEWSGRIDRPLPDTPADANPLDVRIHETQLGREFVLACAAPTDGAEGADRQT
jgi:hypothetical protein